MPPNTETPAAEKIKITARMVAAKMINKEMTYAVVGGAACSVLGHTRVTDDVDFVVLKGNISAARSALKEGEGFTIDARTRHTKCTSTGVHIDIIAPPGTFMVPFEADTPLLEVDPNIKVLKPTLLLNAKIGSIGGRSSLEKKLSDASDINFCLHWCAENSMWPTSSEVPKADKVFVDWFVENFPGGQEAFTVGGWDFKIGQWKEVPK